MSPFDYRFKIITRVFSFIIGMLDFSRFFILNSFPATNAFHMCVEYDKTKQPLQTRYDRTYIYDRYYIRTYVYVFLFSVKKRVFE